MFLNFIHFSKLIMVNLCCVFTTCSASYELYMLRLLYTAQVGMVLFLSPLHLTKSRHREVRDLPKVVWVRKWGPGLLTQFLIAQLMCSVTLLCHLPVSQGITPPPVPSHSVTSTVTLSQAVSPSALTHADVSCFIQWCHTDLLNEWAFP